MEYQSVEAEDRTDTLPLPLDRQLCFALYGASMAMTRVYKPLLDELGITYPQYLVLHALWEEDGRTIGAIANRLGLEPSTVTPLVKRMETAGLLTRRRDPTDERHVRVALTERGWALRTQSACLTQAVIEKTGVDLAELAILTDSVNALLHALSGRQKPGGTG